MVMKHAYLIMAHTDLKLLNVLLKCIDDDRNDIFIHIDKKSDLDMKEIYQCTKSKCAFIEQMSVQWGGDSQIKCELNLLRAAYNNEQPYDYYHLISGADLPIKSQDEIHEFFKKHNGSNYIKVDPNTHKHDYIPDRVGQYHMFQNIIGRNKGHLIGIIYRFDMCILKIQKILKINRLKRSPYVFYKGTNWFSITNDMVEQVLKNEKFIRKYCYCSLCADEIFLQTVAYNTELKHTIVDRDLREIDWVRGNPHTWRDEDFILLKSSENIFARKFSTEIDSEIIEKISRIGC